MGLAANLTFQTRKLLQDCSSANELEDRLIDFAARIIHLANALLDSLAAKHIARQLTIGD